RMVPPATSAEGPARSGRASVTSFLASRYRGIGDEPEGELGPQAAALLCCELAALYEHMAKGGEAGALDKALACYEEALRQDLRCRPAARALVALYRGLQRPVEMLAAMARLLPLLRDDGQRLALLLEMGQAAETRILGLSEGPALREAQEYAISAFGE